MSQQQQAAPYVPQWRGKQAEKQRSEQIKKLVAQTEKQMGEKSWR